MCQKHRMCAVKSGTASSGTSETQELGEKRSFYPM